MSFKKSTGNVNIMICTSPISNFTQTPKWLLWCVYPKLIIWSFSFDFTFTFNLNYCMRTVIVTKSVIIIVWTILLKNFLFLDWHVNWNRMKSMKEIILHYIFPSSTKISVLNTSVVKATSKKIYSQLDSFEADSDYKFNQLLP